MSRCSRDGKGGFKMSFNGIEGAYMSGAALANVLARASSISLKPLIQGDLLGGATPTGAIEIRPAMATGRSGILSRCRFRPPLSQPI